MFEKNQVNFVVKFLAMAFAVLAIFFWMNKEPLMRQSYGAIPGYLDAGDYSLTIAYHSTAESAALVVETENITTTENVRQPVELARTELQQGENTAMLTIHLEESVSGVQLSVKQEKAETAEAAAASEAVMIQTVNIQGYRLLCYDNYFLAALFFALAAGVLVYGTRFYRNEHNTILLLIGIGVLASIPLFTSYLIVGHDIEYHAARINGIYEGIKAGQFPVRVNPVQLEGYGYISGIMYPQLFLYFPALLKFFNISTTLGLKLLFLGANLGTSILCYYSVKHICKNERVALYATLLYVFNPYRLMNFYLRGAVGECLAMTFLPLVLWGTYEILWNNRKKWYLLTLGMCGVLNSHILSLELYSVLIAMEMVWWFFTRNRQETAQRLLSMVKAAGLTIVWNLYFLGPFLSFSRADLECFFLQDIPMWNYVVDLMKLFAPFPTAQGRATQLGYQNGMTLTLGILSLVGALLFVYCLCMKRETTQEIVVGKHCLVFAFFFIAMTLWVAPWKLVLQNGLLSKLLAPIQFPWRLLGVGAMLLSIVAAVGIFYTEELQSQIKYIAPVVLAVIALTTGYFFESIAQEADMNMDKMEVNSWDYADKLYLYHYAGNGLNEPEHFDREQAYIKTNAEGQVAFQNYQKDGLHITTDVTVNENPEPVKLFFPLYYHPGYEIRIDGEKAETLMEGALVTCIVSPGSHHIEVSYEGLPLFRICDWLTAAGIAGTAVLIIWQHRRKKPTSLHIVRDSHFEHSA